MNHMIPFVSGAAVVLVLHALAVPAQAVDLAGTAWVFSGSQDYDKNGKVDSRHEMRGRKRPLKGSSCCESLFVAFPTNETFSLRHEPYVIATGVVQGKGPNLTLRPDEPSRGMLLWWLENQLESFWNAGVFDLDLNLWLTTLSSNSIKVKLESVRGEQVATLKLNLGFRGEIRGFDHTRVRGLVTGPVRGKATIEGKRDVILSLQELDEYYPGYPLPPILSCDEKAALEEEDYFEEFRVVTAASWGGPDYCRE